MEILQAAISLKMYDGSRDDFFRETLAKTCESYGNTPDDTWFIEAVKHRVLDSEFILQASLYGEIAGYVGVDVLLNPCPIAYVGIATVFEEHKREGVLQALFEPLTQYDGLLIRTQNPSVAYAVYRKYGMVMPLTEKPSSEALQAGETLYQTESFAFDKEWQRSFGFESESALFEIPSPGIPYYYERDTMIARRIYNGRRLTKGYNPRSSNRWFNEEMDTIIDANAGDAVCLFAK